LGTIHSGVQRIVASVPPAGGSAVDVAAGRVRKTQAGGRGEQREKREVIDENGDNASGKRRRR